MVAISNCADVALMLRSIFRGNPIWGIRKYYPELFRLVLMALRYGLKTESGIAKLISKEMHFCKPCKCKSCYLPLITSPLKLGKL